MLRRKGSPPPMYSSTAVSMVRRAVETLFDPLFWLFFIIAVAVSLLAAISWRVRITAQLIGLLPFVVAFLAVYVVRGVSRVSGGLYWKESSERSEKYAQWEFDVTQHLKRARSLAKHGLYKEAAGHFEEVIARDRKNLQARYELGRVLDEGLNLFDEAAQMYRTVLELAPPDLHVREEAAEHLARLVKKQKHREDE